MDHPHRRAGEHELRQPGDRDAVRVADQHRAWVPNVPVGVTDVSNVRTANASLTKTGSTGLTLPNNNTPDQFTVGETITYTVDAVVPAGTSLPSGTTLTDAIPSGLQYVAGSGNATYSSNWHRRTVRIAAGLGDVQRRRTNLADLRQRVRQREHHREQRVPAAVHREGARLDLHARPADHQHGPVPSRARSTAPRPTRPGWSSQIRRSPSRTTPVPPSTRARPITYTLNVTNPSPASPSAANPCGPTRTTPSWSTASPSA